MSSVSFKILYSNAESTYKGMYLNVVYFDDSLISPPERRSNFDILKCMLTFR
jgi:hypothetical protein